ncbi:MAG: hypothetical protein ACOWW1_11195, partial [archaeon]
MKIFSTIFLTVFLCCFLLCSASCAVFASSAMWNRLHETEFAVKANSIIETSDGEYAVAGGLYSPDDFWLIKLDESGNIVWNRTYGGKQQDVVYSLVETSDGGYALAGFTESFGDGSRDFWLVKTESNGNMQWNQTYGGPNPEEAYSLIETSDGGYALVGYVKIPDVIKHNIVAIKRGADFWVVKTDSKGNMEWNQTYGGREYERAYSVVEANDGGYVIAGDSWLIKLDSQGNTEWEHNDLVGGARSLVKTSDGGYALTGGGFLTKTDSFGNIQWNQTHGGTSLVETADDGGFAFLSGSGLVKTDAQGIIEWNIEYETNSHPGTEWSRLNSVIETSEGGYVIAGDIFNWFTGAGMLWVIQTDNYGVVPEFSSWLVLPVFLVCSFS